MCHGSCEVNLSVSISRICCARQGGASWTERVVHLCGDLKCYRVGLVGREEASGLDSDSDNDSRAGLSSIRTVGYARLHFSLAIVRVLRSAACMGELQALPPRYYHMHAGELISLHHVRSDVPLCACSTGASGAWQHAMPLSGEATQYAGPRAASGLQATQATALPLPRLGSAWAPSTSAPSP